MSKLKTQIGEALTSDFSENTWTFEMQDNFSVTAGEFAILPKDKYERLLVAMKGIVNSMSAHPDYEPNSEFMDMVTRCEDILDDVEQ
ncbi:hypothetical protein QLS31_16295 [Flavobacterium sp. XS2P24]|uniref:hypothetical protein n=1 Tax=Flavobacterium sp. XS2P24 TaxID=3041249 RepID=UPI0024A83C19|nr:hypothetical protein [Flavobacterium sp. XS2P24]MDI6051385.1 hypothetical protein [Flavobacterium sp. XS2P24]